MSDHKQAFIPSKNIRVYTAESKLVPQNVIDWGAELSRDWARVDEVVFVTTFQTLEGKLYIGHSNAANPDRPRGLFTDCKYTQTASGLIESDPDIIKAQFEEHPRDVLFAKPEAFLHGATYAVVVAVPNETTNPEEMYFMMVRKGKNAGQQQGGTLSLVNQRYKSGMLPDIYDNNFYQAMLARDITMTFDGFPLSKIIGNQFIGANPMDGSVDMGSLVFVNLTKQELDRFPEEGQIKKYKEIIPVKDAPAVFEKWAGRNQLNTLIDSMRDVFSADYIVHAAKETYGKAIELSSHNI